MIHHFVFDTVGFINFHAEFFESENRLSKKIIAEIEKCLSPDFIDYKLIIPSIVFIEVFDTQLLTDNKARRFRQDILTLYLDCEDVEIKGLEKEVMEIYNSIDDNIIKLETHDKIILSSAIQMKGKLITNDGKLKTFVNATKSIEIVF